MVNELIMESYYNLADSIIKLAVNDYRSYCKTVNKDWDKMQEYQKQVYSSKIAQLEKFFVSSYGMFISRGVGDLILEKLKKEFKEA